ncbi:MAG: divalent-cation tolerance protein CutA [Solirubrobacterales bacterium]
MTDTTLIYITAANEDDARRLGQTLVEERLAACANILPGITSVYWWEGRLNEDREVALLLKTRADLVDGLIARARELHSYTCPCVVALPITAGNPAFLEWVKAETR